MSKSTDTIDEAVKSEYKYGFYSDIETESAPPGLNEGIIRFISDKKNEPEWLLEWRLKAYRHWTTLEEPKWQKADYPKIDYQDIIPLFPPSAPVQRRFQGPPAKSKFLAGAGYFVVQE